MSVNTTLWLVAFCWVNLCVQAESLAPKQVPLANACKASELFYQRDLQGAYALFLQAANRASAETNWFEGCHDEWWMGRIQELLGDLELAHEHYEKSLVYIHEAPAADSLRAQKEELGLLANLTRVCEQEGKVGCAFAAHTEGNRLVDLFWTSLRDAEAKSDADRHRFAMDYNNFWTVRYLTWTMVERAQWLQRTGEFDESEQSLRALLGEVEMQQREGALGHEQDLIEIWHALGGQAAFLEHFDEAIAMGAKIAAVPVERENPEYGWTRMVHYAYWLAQREGVSQHVWDVLSQSMRRYDDSLPYYMSLMAGRITKANLLAQDGQIEAALPILDEVIGSVRTKGHLGTLAWALRSRAKCKLEIADLGTVGDDLKESLAFYRTLGNKVEEVGLYELYARWLGEQGRYAEALRTWEDAYRLCETLRLHFRSLHMLLGMADLQLHLGSKAELVRIWERIDKFVAAHEQLPEPTQLRLHLAQMDYLKFQGDQQGLQAAYSQTLAFVNASSLTPYQTRAFSSYDLKQPIVVGAIGVPAQPIVDLQPIMTSTHVCTGELAHARFGIFNPSASAAAGRVKLVSSDAQFEWTPTDQGWNVELSRGTASIAVSTNDIIIPPGSASALYFEALPAASGATNRVSITWQGASTAEAVWEYSASPDSRTVAIVSASLAGENPFYAVPFYHEIYFRSATTNVCNFRVKTSEPCRVEILDATTDKLVAIEANGDGYFDGPGDVLYSDSDGDGFPDFVLSTEHDAARFELLVYPASRVDRGSGEIDISLSIRENQDWVELATDKLEVR